MINLIRISRLLFVYLPLIIGVYFLLSNAVAMIRFPDVYSRLHVGSKCLLAGGTSILVGCIVLEGINYVSLKLIVIIIILLITNPIAIHVIASFAYNDKIIAKPIIKNDTDD